MGLRREVVQMVKRSTPEITRSSCSISLPESLEGLNPPASVGVARVGHWAILLFLRLSDRAVSRLYTDARRQKRIDQSPISEAQAIGNASALQSENCSSSATPRAITSSVMPMTVASSTSVRTDAFAFRYYSVESLRSRRRRHRAETISGTQITETANAAAEERMA